ncbi:MAG: PilZ domain-containing protein [Nitrospiraceae bacterium]|nr:MAG: PilZ domain-containing protein [Nitrospiraceae bacterium]
MKEQRKYIRVPVDRPVMVVLSNGSEVKTKMINISVEGLAVLHPAPAEIGTELGFIFTLPCKSGFFEVNVKGVVRHYHLQGVNYYIGIELTNVSAHDRGIIDEFVALKCRY